MIAACDGNTPAVKKSKYQAETDFIVLSGIVGLFELVRATVERPAKHGSAVIDICTCSWVVVQSQGMSVLSDLYRYRNIQHNDLMVTSDGGLFETQHS